MTYLVTREVIEWIEVAAVNEDEAEVLSSEQPIDFWTRDIKDVRIEEVSSNPQYFGAGSFRV